MLKMTKKSEMFLRKNIPNILTIDEINEALEILYDFIDEKGFEPPHYLWYNELGKEAQDVYDDLYVNN